ncbi:CaiB/BaiF CoA-transferase family protein [Halovivax sp.]|uniref:CaiB/BaiF CoA transferase family protein n=1 Tax=Halovivax sp. TaxID=1935978 RepID=UPI0025C469FF|nr:CaiB/BaiF CoA-transferase family protein [Halovivax sp.]
MRLDDVRVIDLTRLLPGPYATRLLADLGADVIRVEPPDTVDYARFLPPTTDDGHGALFAALNRGKRSVALDLTDDDGRAAFDRLLDDADVLIEGFRPGVVDRLGVDPETVRAEHPSLVYCSLSAYGQDGPYRDRAGHDLNYVGLAGLLEMTRRDADEAPRIPGYPVADVASGAMAAFAIVSGLCSRELGDGTGTFVDLSMLETLLSFSLPVTAPAAAGADPRPGATPLTGGLPWYDVYEAADGRYVTFAALEPRFWRAFCDAVDRPDLRDAHAAVGTVDEAERAALGEELAAIFASRTREEWVALGDPEVPVEPVLTPAEALDHPQVSARDALVGAGWPDSAVGANGRDSAAADDVPGHGEHTVEVLDAVGLDPAEIDTLVED